MAINNKKLSYRLTYQTGVTLVELVVVIAIFAIVSSVLLFNYSNFSTNVSIRNLSQDLALTIRKAQTYATSVQGVSTAGGGARSYPAYGISFSLDTNGGVYQPNKKKFVLFVDTVDPNMGAPNKQYDAGSTCGTPSEGDECLESYSIESADSIVSLCSDATGCISTGSFDVSFHRPSPDAIICYKSDFSARCSSTVISYLDIVLESAQGTRRTVSVWNTGQISAK